MDELVDQLRKRFALWHGRPTQRGKSSLQGWQAQHRVEGLDEWYHSLNDPDARGACRLCQQRKLSITHRRVAADELLLDQQAPIPVEILQHPTISYFSRHGLFRHYNVRSNWDYPGFYLGDVANLHDLVTYWNLRATDTSLLFVDRAQLPRYAAIMPEWTRTTNEFLAGRRFDFERKLAIWRRREVIPADHEVDIAALRATFGEGPFTICAVDIFSWNGLNLQAPMMVLGETSQMGLLDTSGERPKLSFAFAEKPFVGETWFHTQHLVASLSFIGGLYSDDLHALTVPYVPELNEFLARAMHFEYSKLRVEPGRIGLVIDASDTDASLSALPVDALFERIYKLAGLNAQPSPGGLLTRQLLTQLGSLRGASVFKIPGVRRLLKRYGLAGQLLPSGSLPALELRL